MMPVDIFLIFAFDRNYLLTDTFQAIAELKNPEVELKKPFKIIFKGKPAVDEAAVQRELFELTLNELCDPARDFVFLAAISIGFIKKQMIPHQARRCSLRVLCLSSRFQ
jgi:hypothetical protein